MRETPPFDIGPKGFALRAVSPSTLLGTVNLSNGLSNGT
jgi:hypothetical protein